MQLSTTMPTDQRYLRDPRLAVAEVLALVLRLVRDTGESAPQADEAAKRWNRL